MKKISQIVLLLLMAVIASGQESGVIERLENKLKGNLSDTSRIRLLTVLAGEYRKNDTTRARLLIQESKELSAKKSYAFGLGLSNEAMGELHYYHGEYEKAIKMFKAAQEQYLLDGAILKLAGAIIDEGNAHLFLSEYDVALSKYEESLQLFEAQDFSPGMCRALNNMGIIYKNFGEYEKALKSYRSILKLYIEAGDEQSLLDVYINIGVVLVKRGDYDHALDNFNQALVLAEKYEDLEKQGIALMNSGVIHNKMNNYYKALGYYEKALEISRKIGNKVEISRSLTNIGTNYIALGEFQLAEEFINRGLEIKKELGEKKSIANCYDFLAEIKYHQKDYPASIEMDKKAIEMKRMVNDPDGLARCFGNISRTYFAMEQPEFAKMFADSALELGSSLGTLEHIISAYTIKKDIAYREGNFKEAYELAELRKFYSDSLMNINKVRAVNEIEVKYQAKVLEEENERLLIQSELDSVLIHRHKKILVLVLVALFLIAISIVLLFTIQRKQKQYNHSLEKKNQIITKQNIKLDRFNRTKDKILSVITHDLRGTIGNQLTALSVLAKEEFRDEEERKIVFSRLANSATLSLELLENLTLWTKIQEGLIGYHPEESNLNQTFKEVLELFDESIENKELALYYSVKDDFPCFYDQYILKSVLKNLLSNAIKFSNRGGQISAGIMLEKDFLWVYIIDEGIGISKGEISQLMQGKITKMRRGTENEKGSGLGLSLVKTFLEMHGTSLKIESSDAGTKVSFPLPIKRPGEE